ncbi:hypothetical protein RN001_010555 [Aquatica leii]|uniref:Uncharacterized protein n=1 Tax=Aquatica leii TaxID=1421715 RepID=A0AAN7P6M6_9COLE|nr:hypothetical protein RN001_010555 [Aquatica leii]
MEEESIEEEEENDDERRQRELLDFIDDFLNSEEFTHIRLRNVVPVIETRKRFYCRCKECWIQPEVVMTRSALVKKRRELYIIQKRYERYLKNINVRGIRRIQEKGIVTVREKIAEARQAYWCHKKERDLVIKTRRERALDDLADMFDVNTKFINIASSCVTKVIAYKKLKRFNERKRKQRTIAIVRKILHELKTAKTKTPKKVKVCKCVSEIAEQEKETLVIDVPKQEEAEEEFHSPPDSKKVTPAQSPVTAVVVPTVAVPTAVVPANSPKLREDELILPYIPVVNTRKRYEAGEAPKTDELLDDLSKMLGLYKKRASYKLAEQLLKGKEYDKDPFFRTSPNSITFQSYTSGKTYTKKIRVYNGGTVPKRCMFNIFKVDDAIMDMFKAEKVGVHALLPGMHFDICITFSPGEIYSVAKGRGIFITYTPDAKTFLQFACHITCLPLCSTISIKPKTLHFESMPIWEAKNNPIYKTLTIYNFDTKECLIAVTKINYFDELYEEESTESSETLNDSSECELVNVQSILNSCTYSAGKFSFGNQYLSIPANSKKTVKVYFRDVDHVGSYYENYCITTFEETEKIKCVGTYEVSITAEITGHFIEVEPLTIDFNVCVFNSVYHLPFKIINTSNLPYCVSIKFPSSLKHYLWSDAHQVMIQGGATNTYQLKFIPRSGITRCSKYYDEDTNILEFPVYISISKKHSTIPPRKVVVVAVISEPNGLALSSCDMHTYYNKFCDVDESNECIIDLGQCTTAETVYTTLKLTNNSNVFQIFGFINLPSYLQVMPNFGFGEIMPHETKTLTLSFNPEPKDIPNYNLECEYADTSMSYSIVVETLKNLGGIDEVKFTYAMIANLLERMELALNEKPQRSLMKDVRVLIDLLRNENFFCLSYIDASVEEASDTVVSEILCPSLEIVSGEEEEEEEFVINSNKLSVKATILDPLCYLSYQYVEFPDTPCGSYSVMSIHLRARTYVEDAKCVCYYGKKYGKCKAHLDYKVRFEVVGDCDQISVEPTCGNLKSGEEIRLNLIARPVIPKKEVVKTAMKLKREELLLTTMAQPIPTNKKNQPVTPTQITDKDIVLTRSDLYRTEIELSKCLKPYFLKANFCCTINYMNLQHKLYFKTLCKVTRPNFIHNLKSQHIAFGLVPIGQSKRTVIEIENISEVPIHPVVSLLSPTGFFTVPYLVDLELAPYHVLHLPVTCNPDKPKHVR